MNVHDFITKQEIEEIAKDIQHERDFKAIERKVKRYRFTIRSTKTATRFCKEVGEGSYMISLRFHTGNRGNGMPFAGKELDQLKNADSLTEFIDEYLEGNRIEGYETLKDEKQLTLF